MKRFTHRILALGALLFAGLCHGQDDLDAPNGEGWFLPVLPPTSGEFDPNGREPKDVPPQVPGGATPIAEVVTSEISALAKGLQSDPKRIFDYVHDRIRYVHYFGSHKGATLTLLERSGNDFDQCSLLVALLRAAALSPVYRFGVVGLPYASTNHQDYQHWVGTTSTNTDWDQNLALAKTINSMRGFGFPFSSLSNTPNFLMIQHVWVEVNISNATYWLDPSFKVSEPVAGINLATSMAFNASALLNAAGGAATPDYVQGLNEVSLNSNLQSCVSTLLNTLGNRYPNASVLEVAGGQQIVSSTTLPLAQSMPLVYGTDGGNWPISSWNYIPTQLMATLTVTYQSLTNLFYTPGLNGDRLSLTFNAARLAQLWLQDSQISSAQTPATSNSVPVSVTVQHPYGSWNIAQNALVRTNVCDQSVTKDYPNSNATSVSQILAFPPRAKKIRGNPGGGGSLCTPLLNFRAPTPPKPHHTLGRETLSPFNKPPGFLYSLPAYFASCWRARANPHPGDRGG